MLKAIPHGNDYRVQVTVKAPDDTTTGTLTPVSGLVLNVRLSLTASDPLVPGSGTAIDAALNKSATELPGKPGTYACIFEGSDVDSFIGTAVTEVYVIIEAGVGDILCNERVDVKRLRRPS